MSAAAPYWKPGTEKLRGANYRTAKLCAGQLLMLRRRWTWAVSVNTKSPTGDAFARSTLNNRVENELAGHRDAECDFNMCDLAVLSAADSRIKTSAARNRRRSLRLPPGCRRSAANRLGLRHPFVHSAGSGQFGALRREPSVFRQTRNKQSPTETRRRPSITVWAASRAADRHDQLEATNVLVKPEIRQIRKASSRSAHRLRPGTCNLRLKP